MARRRQLARCSRGIVISQSIQIERAIGRSRAYSKSLIADIIRGRYQLGVAQAGVDKARGDAKPRGIKTGDRVRVRSGSGQVEGIAQLTQAIRPGVVGADVEPSAGDGCRNAARKPLAKSGKSFPSSR